MRLKFATMSLPHNKVSDVIQYRPSYPRENAFKKSYSNSI